MLLLLGLGFWSIAFFAAQSELDKAQLELTAIQAEESSRIARLKAKAAKETELISDLPPGIILDQEVTELAISQSDDADEWDEFPFAVDHYIEAVESRRASLVEISTIGAFWALLPALVFWLLGSVSGWIYRGFKQSSEMK